MKNSDKHTDRPQSEGSGRYRREWAVALFSLLMATALPALAAMMAGISSYSEEDTITEETAVCLCRHETNATEELTFGRLLALSLASTNPSDTPCASLEAQAILLRSRGVWWMNYCGTVEGEGGVEEGGRKIGLEKVDENWENGAPVEENGSQANGVEEIADETKEREKVGAKIQKKGVSSLPILCDSPVHGLPYLSYEELNSYWGEQEAGARLRASEKAVELTRGQVLCYEGEIVPALLHHSSGGVTRSVENLPWLAAVPTPETGREAICRLSAEEVRHSLAAKFGLLLPADPALWELIIHTASDGRVDTVEVTGEHLPGTAVAEALSLPSTTFSLQVKENTLIFVCTGEGSGCGLSREGAAIYASGGLSCGEILAHYYPDCTVGMMGK